MDGPTAVGQHLAFHVDDKTGLWTPIHRVATPNTLLYTWGYIIGRCVGMGDTAYRVSVMYLEFDNNTEDRPVSVPSFTRQDGIDYYNGLASNPWRDYLRVPIRPYPDIEVAPGFEQYLDPDQGNCVIFFAQSQGTAGVYGRPFSDGVNSVVFGVALAAAPVPNDPTQDVVFSRSYYQAGNQVPKVPSGQVGIQYPMTFK
jgi:hypothetical protein